jgi:hypothetical protein
MKGAVARLRRGLHASFFGYDASSNTAVASTRAGHHRRRDARQDLVEAMLTIAKTGKGPSIQTPSVGCSIKWKAA